MRSHNNSNEVTRISFDEYDDEDYTVVFYKNSFSYKIISTNDLKTDSENDNEKVNMPLFPSPELSVSCIDDLDVFKDFENVFPAIVYNDALTSKSDFSTEPTLCPQHIDEFDLRDETSLSEYVEEEQNILYFNPLFLFNIIYPNDLKSDKDNDDNEIDMIQSSGGNENTQGSNKLLEASYDKIDKVFITKSFVIELNVNIVAGNYLVNGMLFNLIKNLYVSFGIPFDPKRYYKDGDYTRMMRRPRAIRLMAPLPPRDQRHLWLCYQVEGYTKEIVHDFEQRLETIFGRHVNRVHILYFKGLTPDMRQDLAERMRMVYIGDDGQELGGARRSMTWRQFILALGLHTAEEMAEDGFREYCMDRGAANVSYLLAQYLFKHAEGRKSGARLSGGHFIGRLAHHFGLVNDDGLRGLSVVTREIPLIDMERQPDATAGALGAVKDALAVDEGAQADPAPVQAPQPPPPAAGPRCKEIDDVGEVFTIWKSGSVGVLKLQDGCSTHILAHKLNLENLPSQISGEFLILILLNSHF
ncbi:hypothetical protein Tco_0773108 [Tanacetum coccineum]|uniref:Uncharacterized protein n=1 Tax=Tanacetum coccineum TaxID=301880 RepID=A0ABQ4ZMS5_9ASTR